MKTAGEGDAEGVSSDVTWRLDAVDSTGRTPALYRTEAGLHGGSGEF